MTLSIERTGINPFAPEDHPIQQHEHYMIIFSRNKREVMFCMSYDISPLQPEPGLAANHIADRLLLIHESVDYDDWLSKALAIGFDAFGHEEAYRSMYERWSSYDIQMTHLLEEWYNILLYEVKHGWQYP